MTSMTASPRPVPGRPETPKSPDHKKFFVTFGVGTVLRNSYLVCTGPDENTVRLRLNMDMKQGMVPAWCSIYQDIESVLKHNLIELPVRYEAIDQFASGIVNP